MASLIVTPYESGRLWANSYAGKTARACLAVNTGSLGISSTTAQWDAAEISGNGYSRYTWTIPSGSYNSATERFEAPEELAGFQASTGGVGMSWDTLYIVIGSNSGVSFLFSEAPNIALYPGQNHAYKITLFTDGFVVN